MIAQEMSVRSVMDSFTAQQRLPAQQVSQGAATPPTAAEPTAQPTTTPDATSAMMANNSDIFLVCLRGKENRWLRAFKLDSGRCKTYYSKEGYVQVVSSASYFASCEAVMNSVRKNIEEGGFKCQEKNLESMIEFE